MVCVALPELAVSEAVADDQELAKQLVNPVAKLISVPFQGNYNEGIGPEGEGEQFLINVQPVVPISLSKDWYIISRTIVPVISQQDVFPGAGEQLGLGNTLQSLFLSPARPVNGVIWGAGPVFYLPTNTDELLGPEKWGAGPTGVALWQGGPWTIGMLFNHVWSFAGAEEDADINSSYFQPFLSYTTRDAWSFTLNTESTYDWEAEEWSVPLNGTIAKLVKFGDQPVSIFGGVRYWAETPEKQGPEG